MRPGPAHQGLFEIQNLLPQGCILGHELPVVAGEMSQLLLHRHVLCLKVCVGEAERVHLSSSPLPHSPSCFTICHLPAAILGKGSPSSLQLSSLWAFIPWGWSMSKPERRFLEQNLLSWLYGWCFECMWIVGKSYCFDVTLSGCTDAGDIPSRWVRYA